MQTAFETEICVIGAGPAGATIARRLALLGHQVCLIERATFPRQHIGESLPPGILPVLDALGLRAHIENAGFLRPNRSIIHWSSTLDPHKQQAGEPGFQVDRGAFDRLLLEAAREARVRILQPATVISARQPNDAGWQLELHSQGLGLSLSARFLIDASGKGGLLPGQRQRYTEPTLALYGYWHKVPLTGPETRVEAGENAWYWGAPLPDGTFNATLFISPRQYRASRQGSLETFYRAQLRHSSLLSPCLNGKLIGPVMACNASGYADSACVGPDFLKVGEAAFAIDPLSSQGVQAAMLSALQGSIVVHTLLTQAHNAQAAMTFYRDRQQETVQRHARWASQAYAGQDLFPCTLFWQQRQRSIFQETSPAPDSTTEPRQPPDPGLPVRLCAAASMMPMPTIQGDSIIEIAALTHPSLPRPVAFLDNLEVLPLLAIIQPGDKVREILEKWRRFLPAKRCARLLGWLWTRHILVPD